MKDAGWMWEQDAANQWERENADDAEEDKLKEAAYELSRAWEAMSDALDILATAAEKVEGTAAYDKVCSLIDDLDSLQTDVAAMKTLMRKGRC